MATAKKLGLSPIRRNPAVFSMTDGTGLLELAPKDDLDPDDNAGQQIFHELCHWVVNGAETFTERDWGFPLTDEYDWRELACLRLQAGLAERYGLRDMFGPTGIFREYYDNLPADVLQPLDNSEREALACARARQALIDAERPPWNRAITDALAATAQLRATLQGFISDYQSDVADDTLPCLWGPGGSQP